MPALDPDSIDTPEALRERYVERTRTICNDCGARPDLPTTVVAALPRPWRRHVDGRVQCADCWSGEVATETALDGAQARVLALDALGFDAASVARSVGTDPETVRDYRRTIDALRHESDDPTGHLLGVL